MTLMNKIIRIFPKKKVDVKELERSAVPKKLSQAETIVVNSTVKKSDEYKQEDSDEGKNPITGEYEIVEREILPEKIICPDCGGITLEGLEFCDKCGGELGNNL